jgi:hypothetical protein
VATAIGLGHFVVILCHLWLVVRMQPDFPKSAIPALILVNLLPVVGALALKKGYRKSAAILIAAPLAVGFLIGTYAHFLSAGSDNVFRMAAGEFTLPFQVSAVLLVLLESLGMWVGVRTRESYFAIAAASKERGISFVGHVPATMTPAEASDLGQKSIEHLEFVPKSCHALFESVVGGALRKLPSNCDPQSLKELLHRFAQNGTWLDPTIQSFRYWAPTQWTAIFSGFRELVPSIRQSHVSILAGTDSSSVLEEKDDPPGTSLHDELALLVEAGFTPSEALRAATLNPALFLGLSDSLGTIEAGKTASVVLLEANSLQDIRNTQRIVAVISEGRYFDRQMLGRMVRENCRKCLADAAH